MTELACMAQHRNKATMNFQRDRAAVGTIDCILGMLKPKPSVKPATERKTLRIKPIGFPCYVCRMRQTGAT